MNVILVSSGLSRARSINVGAPQLAAMGLSLLVLVLSLVVLLHYLSLRYAVNNDSPYLRSVLSGIQARGERADAGLSAREPEHDGLQAR